MISQETEREDRRNGAVLVVVGKEKRLRSSSPPLNLVEGERRISSPSLSQTVSLLLYRRPQFQRRSNKNMEHNETGCQSAPEGPILCINNCGFFGSAATMNMCSKCHKDIVLKQQQAKLAEASIDSIVNGSSSSTQKNEPMMIPLPMDPKLNLVVEPTAVTGQSTDIVASGTVETKRKEGPTRCSTCKKRVGLTGFNCRCGNIFCGTHRYSEKHECPFDYRTAGRDAIAKANPLIKAEKLDKI